MTNEWYYTKKQGPVTEAELQELFRSGQLEPEAFVWHEGMPVWEPAQEFLSKPRHDETHPVGEGIHFTQIFSNGWKSFRKHWLLGLGVFVVIVFFNCLLQIPGQLLALLFDPAVWGNLIRLGVKIACGILLLPIFLPFAFGLQYFFLEASRGRANFKNIFSGSFKSWVSLLLLALVSGTLILLGYVCFIIPGIYLLVCYSCAGLLVLDQKLGFWEAMRLSRKTIHKQWFSVFGILFCAVLVAISGILLYALTGIILFGIGIFFTIPFALFIQAEVYRHLFPQFKNTARK